MTLTLDNLAVAAGLPVPCNILVDVGGAGEIRVCLGLTLTVGVYWDQSRESIRGQATRGAAATLRREGVI